MGSERTTDPKIEFVVRLPVPLHERLAQRAADEDRTRAALVRRALTRYLDEPDDTT